MYSILLLTSKLGFLLLFEMVTGRVVLSLASPDAGSAAGSAAAPALAVGAAPVESEVSDVEEVDDFGAAIFTDRVALEVVARGPRGGAGGAVPPQEAQLRKALEQGMQSNPQLRAMLNDPQLRGVFDALAQRSVSMLTCFELIAGAQGNIERAIGALQAGVVQIDADVEERRLAHENGTSAPAAVASAGASAAPVAPSANGAAARASERPRGASWSLAKLLLHGYAVKASRDEQGKYDAANIDVATKLMLALLAPLVSAAEAGLDLQGFPLFPYQKTRILLDSKEGMPNNQTDESRRFWTALIRSSVAMTQATYGPAGSALCGRAGSAWHAALDASSPPQEAESVSKVLFIPAGFAIDARPTMSDCSSSRRTLAACGIAKDAEERGGNMLALTAKEVGCFTGVPTEALTVLRAHMNKVALSGRATVGLMDRLPFDISRHPMAQSVVAKSMLRRVANDISTSAEVLRRPGRLVPRLPYLSDEMIAELRLDIEAVERRASAAALAAHATPPSAATPPPPPPLTRQISTAGSSMLQGALTELLALLAALEQLKATETAAIATALHQLVATTKTSGERGGTADALRFELLRFTGQKTTIWFELVAAALLSSRGAADLAKLNGFISPEATQAVLDGAVAIELRCVLVCHLSFCIGDANKLVSTIRELLARRMLADIAVKYASEPGVAPTRAMLDHALRCGSVNYHESRAHAKLDELVAARERLRVLVAALSAGRGDDDGGAASSGAADLSPEVLLRRRRALVDVAFATCAFDETKVRSSFSVVCSYSLVCSYYYTLILCLLVYSFVCSLSTTQRRARCSSRRARARRSLASRCAAASTAASGSRSRTRSAASSTTRRRTRRARRSRPWCTCCSTPRSR